MDGSNNLRSKWTPKIDPGKNIFLPANVTQYDILCPSHDCIKANLHS